ncbi:MAG: aminotransferase class V-fold PLP-dependent enzyme [Planctomycetota bacterium]
MTDTIAPAAPDVRPEIADPVALMGPGPLTEAGLVEHIHPLFRRVLARDEIYLANHSLGRPLDLTAADVQTFTDLWYRDMDEAWPAWMDAMTRFRSLVATLIGCGTPHAVVPRVNVAQGLRTVLNALPLGRGPGANRPVRVLASRNEFDSVDFTLKAYAHKGRVELTWVELDADAFVQPEAYLDEISRAKSPFDLVVISQVCFSTCQVIDRVDDITRAAQASGSLVMLDTYHAAGVLPGVFDEVGADFATGGNYKYTRGGPGAGWLAVHPRHFSRDDLFSLDTGWFAKADTFGFAKKDTPEFKPGGDGWLEATPAVLTAYQALAGLELVLALGVGRLRTYSLTQQARFAELLAAQGIRIWDHGPRAAFMCIPSDDPVKDVKALKAAGVNTDGRTVTDGAGRTRGVIRVCPDTLNTDAELTEAASRIGAALKR